MGGKRKDLVRKRYFRNNIRQAELLNVYTGHCMPMDEEQKSWKPFTKDDFIECDSELYTFEDKKKGIHPRLRIVDSARLVTYCEKQFYFFIENQEKEDYGMPSRILAHESICYREQANMLRIEYSKSGELHTIEERFSGMKKEDQLIPVISLVLYYGTEPWNGARDLKMMLDVEKLPEKLKVLVGNYPMHLLEIKDIDYLEDFKTDLHETFGFIKYQKDLERLKTFVEENKERFRSLSEDAYDFIVCQTGIRKLEQLKKNYITEEGDYDMCKAIDDLEKRSRQEGRKEGMQAGIQQGERSNAIRNTRMLFKNGVSLELVAASILILSKKEIAEIYREEMEAEHTMAD